MRIVLSILALGATASICTFVVFEHLSDRTALTSAVEICAPYGVTYAETLGFGADILCNGSIEKDIQIEKKIILSDEDIVILEGDVEDVQVLETE